MDEPITSDPRFWVAVAFVCFVALAYKKVSKLLIGALDSRSAKIKVELDRAKHLREEAEAILAEYKKKQTEYLHEAEKMLEKAREDAGIFATQAEKELQLAIEARRKHAIEKIERAETQAVAEVREHVIDIALASARATIVDHIGKLSHEGLIKLALIDIERKIH